MNYNLVEGQKKDYCIHCCVVLHLSKTSFCATVLQILVYRWKKKFCAYHVSILISINRVQAMIFYKCLKERFYHSRKTLTAWGLDRKGPDNSKKDKEDRWKIWKLASNQASFVPSTIPTHQLLFGKDWLADPVGFLPLIFHCFQCKHHHALVLFYQLQSYPVTFAWFENQ